MKYGIREICDVVLKAKTYMKLGKKEFFANEPVLYFDTLKTSSLEGQATTVYAQGGRGNTRLVAWDGEKTVTFTMEDALISPEGLMILAGAGLVEPGDGKAGTICQHITERLNASDVTGTGSSVQFTLENAPYIPDNTTENWIYIMPVKDDEIMSEPYIGITSSDANTVTLKTTDYSAADAATDFAAGAFDSVIIDYYTQKTSNVKQIEITAESFGGNFYLEASTLWRNTKGADVPAEFIIPNCKIQSNFTFTMASSGDPSSFTFTMDAFPDYTRFDHTKKVLAAIQLIEEGSADADAVRHATAESKYVPDDDDDTAG